MLPPEIELVLPCSVTPELIVVMPVQLLVPVRLNTLLARPAKVRAWEEAIAWPPILVPLPEVMLPERVALPPKRFSNTLAWPFSGVPTSSRMLLA
jgi:hypothetical protein